MSADNVNLKRNRRPMGGHGPMGGMGMPVQKAKNFKKSLKRLLSYLKPHRINLIIVLIFAIASTSFAIYAPKVTSKAMNKLQDGYMAKMMLQKMGEGQDKGLKNIDQTMSDGQKKVVEEMGKQMSAGQKQAVAAVEQQMSDLQKKLTKQMSSQMEQMQSAAMRARTAKSGAPAANIDPAALTAIQDFMKLPMIDSISDPQQKADTVLKMIDLLSKMPSNNSSGQSQQIDPALLGTVSKLLKLQPVDSISDIQTKKAAVSELLNIFSSMSNMQQSSGQQQFDPKTLKAVEEFLELPMIDTVDNPDQKTLIIKKMTDLSSVMPKQQETNGTSQPQQQLNEKSLDGIGKFLKLPRLDKLEDADKKADTVQDIMSIGKEAPVVYYFMFKDTIDNGSKDDITKNLKLTQDQIDGVIKAIRETNGKYDFNYIGLLALLLIGMYIISAVFGSSMGLVMSGVAQKTVRDLRREVDNKLAKLPLKYYDMHPHGDILSRVTNDIDTIAQTLQQSLTQIITSIVQILGYIIMMLTISGVLTLIILATLPLYVIVTIIIAKKSQKFFAAQQKELGDLSGHVEEMYTGHVIVKAFGHEKESIEKFEATNDRLYNAGWKAQFVSGIMFPLLNFVSNLGYVMISIIGGIWITKDLLKIGDILAFIQYSRMFTMPMVQTANIANIIQSTVACAERVFEVLDEPEEIPDSTDAITIEQPKGEVKFENVSFRYKEEVPLIENMNLDVNHGHTIAIVGPTGAGKTTLVNLLMRFYEINSGKITVDGVDIKDMKRSHLRKMFGMVLQDTWLFNGTIKDNIAYGRKNAIMEDIVQAAKAAHADHFIRTQPDGYNTVLNEEATNISQGQKQLLTIARAILADPEILILDEATSSVDTRTEVLIQKAMANLMKNRTSFVIAHRLSTIRDAEMILVMNQGSIIEMGNHKELLAKGGFYADLYNSQFAGADLDKEAV